MLSIVISHLSKVAFHRRLLLMSVLLLFSCRVDIDIRDITRENDWEHFDGIIMLPATNWLATTRDYILNNTSVNFNV